MTSTASPAEGVGGHGVAGDSIVLEEEIDQNYVPSEDEVREYAKWLGMELGDDLDLFWIAKEGLKAPLPENWKPCKTVDTEEIYYFNFATGESTWDHPCDEYYRKLYEEEKKKKMTKDKAKHDKSKQQARKDVSQLLGKEKKKKRKPSGKRPARQSSPECVHTALSSASSIFDRKPLPDIGRQPLQGGHSSVHQVASPTQSDKAVPPGDRSPLRTHASSLVGHRLSQHLSVSVGSEKGDEKTGEGSAKPSPRSAPPGSREGTSTHDTNTSTICLQSEHDDVLKELREKHAQDLDALEQAHRDTKHQLEDDHRRSMAAKKRQWAASVESEAEKAQHELNRELQETRTSHSREIERMECSLLDATDRLAKTLAETERVNEAARTEKGVLKSTLADLERRVSQEKKYLQEAQEAAEKLQAAGGSQPGADLQGELALVVSELKDERKHVQELECRLKEANNGTLQSGDGSSRAEEIKRQAEERISSKVSLLEDKLAHIIRENESLRKEVERAAAHRDASQLNDARTSARDRETKTLEHAEVVHLKEALQDAESRLSRLQQDQDQSMQDAKDAAAALLQVQENSVGLELDNKRLVEHIARIEDGPHAVDIAEATFAHKLSDEQDGVGPLAEKRTALKEHEVSVFTEDCETQGLRADLEAAKNDLACYGSEVQKSKEAENKARNDLHAVQMTLRDSQVQLAELKGTLTTVEHEKKLTSATGEELRLENERLKRTMEVARLTPEGETSRETSDGLANELEEKKAQLAAMTLERACLIDEVGALKRQRVRSDGIHQAERGAFDSSLAGHQRQVESLQTMAKKLEEELSAGQRKEEALHATTKDLRESLAASKLEAWRLQEVIRKHGQNSGSEGEMVPVADYDHATAEAREIASRLKLAEDEVEHLKGSLVGMTPKLVGSEGLVASLKDELAEAQSAEKESAQRLEKALSRCLKAEDRLAEACGDRAPFEKTVRGAECARDPKTNEPTSRVETPLLSKECCDAATQTAVTLQEYRDLEQTLLQLREDSERASIDLASSKQQSVDLQQQLATLQQQLADSAAEAETATHQAGQNSELASRRREELVSMSEREQATRIDLLQARSSLQGAEEDCRSALSAADQARRHLADRESGWRHEADDLRVSLKKALATAEKQNQEEARTSEQGEAPDQSLQASDARISSPERPEVRSTDDHAVENEGRQFSVSGASDATSRDSPEELMQKLKHEANQRRHNRAGSCNEASRSWTKKLKEEKSMLALAKEAVRHHKERVKKRQQRLLLFQTRWRNQRHYESSTQEEARPRLSARQRSLEEAKRELDSEVYKLNRFVKELRSSKCWLDQRERKISDFEALLGGGGDASDFDSRLENQASRTTSSGAQNSTPESSSGSTAKLRSLEAMEEELDKDYSAFAANSSVGSFRRPHASMRRDKKPARAQRHPSKHGKENVFPGPRLMHPVEHPADSACPAESWFREHPPQIFPGKCSHFYDGIPSRSRASRPAQRIYLRGPGLSGGVQGIVDDAPDWSSDADLQGWLNRPDLHTRDNSRSEVIARERREHLTKVTVEGRQAQSAVALHVDWLNKLREEMGLLGLHNTKSSRPRPVFLGDLGVQRSQNV